VLARTGKTGPLKKGREKLRGADGENRAAHRGLLEIAASSSRVHARDEDDAMRAGISLTSNHRDVKDPRQGAQRSDFTHPPCRRTDRMIDGFGFPNDLMQIRRKYRRVYLLHNHCRVFTS
jgi:hypothetical protein